MRDCDWCVMQIVARTVPRLEAAAARFEAGKVRPYPVDLSRPADVVALLARINAEVGAVETIVYNASAWGVLGCRLLCATAVVCRSCALYHTLLCTPPRTVQPLAQCP
jgi:NAD(P)-dependent dehydrogenase (short-subunit alcohol dehydrogenase family)